MKNIIQFTLTKEDSFYIAEAVGFPIVTQAHSFEELQKNIQEAVDVFLEGESFSLLGLSSPKPSLFTSFEIPYVATA